MCISSSTDVHRCFVDRNRIPLRAPHQGLGDNWSSSSATVPCPDWSLDLWKISGAVMSSHFYYRRIVSGQWTPWCWMFGETTTGDDHRQVRGYIFPRLSLDFGVESSDPRTIRGWFVGRVLIESCLRPIINWASVQACRVTVKPVASCLLDKEIRPRDYKG